MAFTPLYYKQFPFQALQYLPILQRMGLWNQREYWRDSTALCGDPFCSSGEKQMFLKCSDREKDSCAWFRGDQLALVSDGAAVVNRAGQKRAGRDHNYICDTSTML